MFKQETGRTPDSASGLWNDWRTEKVTRLVRDIRAAIKRVRSEVKLSAAVGGSPARAKRAYFQDSRRWVAEHLLDAVFPMCYEKSMESFRKQLSTWSAMRPRIPVVTGVMFDKRSARTVIEQLNGTARTGGHFSAFAYNSLFDRTSRPGRPVKDAGSSARTALRREVIPYLRARASESRRLAAR
jgi:uncharacterized lipoprotein YddW (UPF0748 family)